MKGLGMLETVVKTEEFKDSPVGRVPKDWQVVKLLDHVSLPNGQLDPKQKPYCDWILIAPDHIESKTGLLLNSQTAAEQNAISGKYGFQPGDVLYSKIRPYLRKAVLADREGLCSADMYPLRPGLTIVPRFLLAVILGEDFSRFATAVSMRSGFPKLNREELGEYWLALPPYEEQKRIAEILDTVEKAIAHTTTLIAKLKQMKAGLLHDLLMRGLDENGELRDPTKHPEQFKDSPLGQIPKDWEITKLESLLNGRPKNGYSPKEVNEWTGTLMLGLSCLTEEGFEPLQLKNAPSNDLKIRAALLNDGDFLLSRSNTRERVALAGIYRYIGVPCIYSDLMMRLSLNEKTCNRFLELLLWHFPVRRQLAGNAQGTSGSMVKISSQTVIETVAALPNLKEQSRIIDCLDTYDTRIRTEEAYRDKLKLQKQGLMHDLLTGKVRVKI